jgi:hypothetical protein
VTCAPIRQHGAEETPKVKRLLRYRTPRRLLYLCVPLFVWWVLLLATPGWEIFARLPGEVALPMLIAAIIGIARSCAEEAEGEASR